MRAKALQATAAAFGLGVVRSETLRRLRNAEVRGPRDLAFLLNIEGLDRESCLSWLPQSTAQTLQDIFVLACFDFQTDRSFVEFGATDGVTLSNSWLLEKKFGWHGLLAEPAKVWHSALPKHRSALIDHRAVVGHRGGPVELIEHETPELSATNPRPAAEPPRKRSSSERRYLVETVELGDLLNHHGFGPEIDFLSVDTEGGEHEILASLDHNRWSFGVIVVEHNFGTTRNDTRQLLERQGYRRVLSNVSEQDDWFVSTKKSDRLRWVAETLPG